MECLKVREGESIIKEDIVINVPLNKVGNCLEAIKKKKKKEIRMNKKTHKSVI